MSDTFFADSAEDVSLFSLLDSLPDAVSLIDPSGRIVTINSIFAGRLGKKSSECIGSNIFELIANFVMAEGVHFRKERCAEVLRSGKRFVFEERRGNQLLNIILSPVKSPKGEVTHLMIILQDITDRKRAEAELVKFQRHMDFALEKSHVGVWDLNLNETTVKRTMEHARIFGYQNIVPEWTLEMFLDHIVPEDRDAIEALIRGSIKKRQDYEFECRIQPTVGEVRWIMVRGAFYVDKSCDESHVLGIVQDITERKRSEKERDTLQTQLLHAQKLEVIGQLAGGIAHDFNNHLTAILGYIELAINAVDEAHPVAKYITTIQKSALRSAELTNKLLAFARKQPIRPKVVNLNMEIEELRPILAQLIHRGIEIEWYPIHHKALITIDPSQIDQILTNFCVNARDAITGSGKITITTDIVQVQEKEDGTKHSYQIPGHYVKLTVTDTGCGIGMETLLHIFEPFFTTKELGKGTGLGLSTIYGIVKQNKGYIDCKSERGKGTTFTLWLPQYEGNRDMKLIPDPELLQQAEKKTILLVEDERDVLNLVKRVLEINDFKVFAASDAEQALEIAAKNPDKINLLLTDVRLPKMNGVELSQRLHAEYPNIKTLFMSGYSDWINESMPKSDRKFTFISKPFTFKELLNSVDKALSMNM